jgi:hypothetical protein
MKTSFARIVVRSLLSAVCGAISGAALLGMPTYLSTETGFLGPESAWWPVAAIAGCVWGVVPGALIGFLVTKFQTTKLISLIVGAAIGTSLLVLLFITGLDPFINPEIFYTGLACIPVGALIGLILSTTNKAVMKDLR